MLPIVLAAITLLTIILIVGYFSRSRKGKKDVDRKVDVDADYINNYVLRFNTNSKGKKK